MHKKAFRNMVDGLLAWLSKVFISLGPFPGTLSTSSTNVGNKHNKQHKKAKNKSALKYEVDFSRTSLVI